MVRKDKDEEKIKRKKTTRNRDVKKERKTTRVRNEREEEKVVETTKEKKNSFSNIEVYVIMIICLALGLVIGIFISGYKANNEKLEVEDQEVVELYEDIRNNYYGDLDKNYNSKRISGLISALDDPYSNYYEGMCATNYKEELINEFVGIGTEVQYLENGDIKFVNIFDDSPAMKAGIEVDDILLKVDGKDVKGLSLDEAVKLIKGGKANDSVEITVLRKEEEKTFNIKKQVINRKTVNINYVDSDKVAVVIIDKFTKTTLKEAKDAFDEIKDKKINNVAIDLRHNYTGYIDVASDIASLFLDKGAVIYKEEYNNDSKTIKSTDDKAYSFNLKLIVDQYTAKAAEVLVSALKDNINVEIIGSETNGDSSIQKMVELKNGDIVEFTVGKWLTSKDVDVKSKKITPDYALSEDEDTYTKLIELFNSNNL